MQMIALIMTEQLHHVEILQPAKNESFEFLQFKGAVYKIQSISMFQSLIQVVSTWLKTGD